MRFGSVCSGIEAASVAFAPLGWKAAWLAEVDPGACAVLAHRLGATAPVYPLEGSEKSLKRIAFGDQVTNWGDMTRLPALIASGEAEAPDMLVGGPPCFPAGTLITTDSGLVPIEDVRVGQMVLTHKSRWQKVLRIGGKFSERTIMLKGQGHPGLVTTEEHPFFACERKCHHTRRAGASVVDRWIEGPDWVAAKDLKGKHWASVVSFPESGIPRPEIDGRESVTAPICEDFLWLAGAYVGDGWTRIRPRHSETIFGVNDAKAALIIERAERLGLVATRTVSRTGCKIQISSGAIARWMFDNFGHGCDSKSLPMWLLGAPAELRRAFLDGYVAMDGTKVKFGHRITTVCWKLAICTRMLANSLGHSSSIGYVVSGREKCVIEGREVDERPYYTVTVGTSNRSSFERDGLRFGCVRSVEESGPRTVYNLEVEEDNSYCADGFVVHNCQSFSVAGKRDGLNDPRGNLTLAFVLIADAIDQKRAEHGDEPSIIFFENVPGILSDKTNAFGCLLAGLAGEDVPLEPPGGRWTNAGAVSGPERAVAWRVLDAQFFGVPQRRNRVFVVASAREGFDPAAVLFEFDGVRRDTPPSREAGESIAGTLDARPTGGGFPGTDGACANHVVPHISDGSGAVAPPMVGRIAGEPDARRCAAQGTDDAREEPLPGRAATAMKWPAEIASTLNAHYGDKWGLEDQHVNQGCPLFVLS